MPLLQRVNSLTLFLTLGPFSPNPHRFSQTDAEADAKAMERAMRFWTLEFHDPILEMVSLG